MFAKLCSLAFLASSASAYTITVVNNCNYKIWPAASQYNFNNSPDFPLLASQYTGGGPLTKGQSFVIQAPAHWLGGRIWIRTGCRDDGTGCAIGDCGGLRCNGYQWTDSLTLAEFGYGDYGQWGGERTSYDISRVQGWNVGMKIQGTGGTVNCPTRDCPRDQAYLDTNDHQAVRNQPIADPFTVTICP